MFQYGIVIQGIDWYYKKEAHNEGMTVDSTFAILQRETVVVKDWLEWIYFFPPKLKSCLDLGLRRSHLFALYIYLIFFTFYQSIGVFLCVCEGGGVIPSCS